MQASGYSRAAGGNRAGCAAVPYRCRIAADPPPLLSSLPRMTQATIVVLVPVLFGAVCGFLASETSAGWWIANVVAALGGIAGGYEHETARSGGTRGLIAGIAFGSGIVLADAITDAAPLIDLPSPLVIFPLITAIGGLALGSLGGRLRARLEADA